MYVRMYVYTHIHIHILLFRWSIFILIYWIFSFHRSIICSNLVHLFVFSSSSYENIITCIICFLLRAMGFHWFLTFLILTERLSVLIRIIKYVNVSFNITIDSYDYILICYCTFVIWIYFNDTLLLNRSILHLNVCNCWYYLHIYFYSS